MDYKRLFHDERAFLRETLEARMKDFGFKNMGRMELFLWDLELFLQIQDRLGDRVVLKGGAATQFYLPKEAQRTSVDIDMLFCGSEEEIDETLKQIEKSISDGSGLFHFNKHVPKNPKTTLPLFTYYTDVPSVLSGIERNIRGNDSQSQELKVEFIAQSEKREYNIVTGEDIFAVHSNEKYQILPLDSLFADKLTTLGCKTIGVQDDRLDDIFETVGKLDFSNLTGMEKGMKIREARDMMIERFGNTSSIPVKVLKGKNPQRIYWAVVRIDNVYDIKTAIENL